MFLGLRLYHVHVAHEFTYTVLRWSAHLNISVRTAGSSGREKGGLARNSQEMEDGSSTSP